jgi:transcriptional regulator with XRE-family HTH domain
MSYAIGNRIKELRTIKKVSQEEMAEFLDTSRQRYSRLENGRLDISYVVIKKIAERLAVSISDITSAEQEKKELVTYFREKNSCDDVVGSVAKIEEILRIFNAHERLYHQTMERNTYED